MVYPYGLMRGSDLSRDRDYRDRERERDNRGDYAAFDRSPSQRGRYYGNEAGSRYPRYGRDDWTTDDLGYFGGDYDRGYGDDTRGYARYGNGCYPNGDTRRGDDGDRRRRGRDEDRGFMERAGDEVASWFGDDDAERRREEDRHRGRGPRGYQRSDSRILEDVNDRLSDDPALDASDIEVTVSQAEVTLTGKVDSRWAKRRAEDCVERVSGVQHVQNNLRVRSHESSESTTPGSLVS